MTRCPSPQRAWLKAVTFASLLALSLALAACATRAPSIRTPTPVTGAAATVPSAPPLPPLTAPSLETRAAFIAETAGKYGLDPTYIESLLWRAQIREATVAAMSRPAEARPWHEYRPLFITRQRIDDGRAFLAAHREQLARVEARYGVPAEIIVAILGVETSWGANTGTAPVLDALYTLAFNYPRTRAPDQIAREDAREAFFRDELGQLFALGRETALDLTALTGSYAGAMGWGQFMPSSYRLYAVDGDGDGKRDLFASLDDVFASVANYFVQKGGWQRGRPVMVRATYTPGPVPLTDSNGEPVHTLAALAQAGYRPLSPLPADVGAVPIMLEGVAGPEYWLTFRNFRALWSYNNSIRYATVVYQLAEAIAGREVGGPPVASAPVEATPAAGVAAEQGRSGE